MLSIVGTIKGRRETKICFPVSNTVSPFLPEIDDYFSPGNRAEIFIQLNTDESPSANATTPRHRRKQIHLTKHRNTPGNRGAGERATSGKGEQENKNEPTGGRRAKGAKTME